MQATPHITTHTGLVRLADGVSADSRPRTLARKIASMLVEFSSGAWMAMDGFIAFFAVILAYALTPWSLALESGEHSESARLKNSRHRLTSAAGAVNRYR